MRTLLAAALLLIPAACGDSSPATTTSGPQPVTGATAGPPTTTTTSTTPTAATVAPPETTLAQTTTTATAGPAQFSVTLVTFGENGFVQITNTGGGEGSLEGHWLCARPRYTELDPIDLAPGRSIWVAAGTGEGLNTEGGPIVGIVALEGALGALSAGGGEVALYSAPEFEDPDAVVDFVAWSEPGGLPGLSRSSVAEAAGMWVTGGLVEVPPESISITPLVLPATGPGDWLADSGG